MICSLLILGGVIFASADSSPFADKSKVLARVDNAEITQEQVDTRKMDSEFFQQEGEFSDKEVLDKIIYDAVTIKNLKKRYY